MKAIIPLCAMLVLGGTADARIGETKEQCVKRYGTLHDETSDGSKLTFMKDGVNVICFLKEGKVWGLCFTVRPRLMTDELPVAMGRPFSDEQTMLLLEANGTKWRKVEGNKLFNRYETEDGKLLAVSDVSGVWIDTRARVEESREQRKPEAVSKALEGY